MKNEFCKVVGTACLIITSYDLNSLPPDIVNFSTLIAFKRSINTVDLSAYCIGSV